MNAVPELVRHLREEMSKVVVGQDELRNQCIVALLCRGHVLLEGVPGIAKTLTVKALSRLMGLEFQRVQCTSDLMPADIVGTNILNMATSAFQLHQGPVFTDLLLVDEVNRMPPRTQAALLECMEEHQVTIDGKTYPLSRFFTVFATQNPIEFEVALPLRPAGTQSALPPDRRRSGRHPRRPQLRALCPLCQPVARARPQYHLFRSPGESQSTFFVLLAHLPRRIPPEPQALPVSDSDFCRVRSGRRGPDLPES